MSTPDSEIAQTFRSLVNMTPHAIESWLRTDESRAVGAKPADGAESTGHHSGREIVKILRKNARDLDEHDYAQMHRVVGYIKRHLAQRPQGDIEHTRWAYSLKNWGHDPTKAGRHRAEKHSSSQSAAGSRSH